MGFPASFLDELRARVPLAQVVGRRVKLTRKGREYQGLCPFHNEKSPSFSVNEDKGFFHCFGCGAHGDAIAFEMQVGNLSFADAVEKLAAEAGLEIPRETPEAQRREARRANLHDAMEAACRFYEAQLHTPGGREGLAYLQGRGLSEQTISQFRLGWAPESRDALKRAIMGDALPETLLIEAGLLRVPEGGGPGFDMFRGRVTFPILDRRGRVIAFGARTLGDNQPKYLNSPDTPLFHKGATLFGLSQAREAARTVGTVMAAEGYMDVIALHQAGFQYAVAPLGTAITEDQIEELWKLADEPILCLDGDSAGQRAMVRAAQRCLPILRPGKSLRFALLPAPEDPDSLIRAQGPQAMRTVLDNALPLIDVIWRTLLAARPVDTPERRAALEHELKEQAALIGDESVRKHYMGALTDRMWQFFRGQRPPPRTGGKPGQDTLKRLPGLARPAPPQGAKKKQERLLLSILLAHPTLIGPLSDRLGETAFLDSSLDKLRRGLLKHADALRDLTGDAVVDQLRDAGLGPMVEPLLIADEYRVGRTKPAHEARVLWESVYILHARDEMKGDAGRAVERLALDMSDANFSRVEALVSSRMRSVEYDEDGQPPKPAPKSSGNL